MNFNKFMFELNNALYENFFRNVEIHRIYIDSDDVIVIRIIAERNNYNYDYGYSVKRKLLDSTTINSIVNELLSI